MNRLKLNDEKTYYCYFLLITVTSTFSVTCLKHQIIIGDNNIIQLHIRHLATLVSF